MGKVNVADEIGEENWGRARVIPEEFQSAVRPPWESSLGERPSVRGVKDKA